MKKEMWNISFQSGFLFRHFILKYFFLSLKTYIVKRDILKCALKTKANILRLCGDWGIGRERGREKEWGGERENKQKIEN